MGRSFSIIDFQKIAKTVISWKEGYQLYLFGSVTRKNSFIGDLDVLIVYDPSRIVLEDLKALRSAICTLVQNRYDLQTDFCCLTNSEARSSNFIREERAKRIL